jgi:hypothetical protein
MATIGDRGASWTNSDGLVVGFGTNEPAQAGAADKNGAAQGLAKTASVKFDYKDMNACTTGGVVNVPVPAGSIILDVRVVCETAWTATGTNTFEVGLTGGDVDLFMSTTVGTSGSMTAGAVLLGDGVGLFGATDTGARELYKFASADTIDIVTAMSDWTGGTASLIVAYI